VILLVVYLIAARWLFRGQLVLNEEARDSLLALDERQMITDPKLLRQSLLVLGATLVGFVIHGVVHIEPATIALAGALALMVVAREDPHDILREVEWPTLFFFIGLFMLVAGVIEIGLIDAVAEIITNVTGGVLAPTTILIMWVSAALSGVIDNIPYTATMIPVVAQLSTGHETDVLWWGLAIGADLGGNATIIGASANVILAAMSEREGHKISFGAFLPYGLAVTFGSMLIATVYVWLRYLL
jgi:Na+/H+ antiporter NhaD/arsenite permease-like protein